jgi:uncharacterized protein YbjQ (UPF0145 family)
MLKTDEKMKDILVSTTSTLDGYNINKYLGVINANIVIGTNIFSDFAASFTDIFGGNSGSYQRKMDLMYKEATKELMLKVQKVGGNAIVGFSIDFDEISGKGKSMFMLSASGTACVVECVSKQAENIQHTGLISADVISLELKQQSLREVIATGSVIYSEEEWSFMMENPSLETIKLLVKNCYYKYLRNSENRANIETLVNQIDYDEACDIVYSIYAEPYIVDCKEVNSYDNSGEKTDVSVTYAHIIRNCRLFNPKKVLDVAKNDLNKAIEILDCDKALYSLEDLKYMEEINLILDAIPDKGKIEMGKGGMFSKEKELFICGNGHKNDKDVAFCTTCGENIKGLKSDQVEKIEAFKDKLRVLSEFLSKK